MSLGPEVDREQVISGKYRGDRVDIWSCGVVLFVLLAGNTPWDEPTYKSAEFQDYVRTEGRPNYDPWPNLPQETLCKSASRFCGGTILNMSCSFASRNDET